MRPALTVTLVLLSSLAFPAAHAELDPRPIRVEPGVSTPGQSITLRWYFTGTKVLVAGGRFGKGAVVTGKSQLTDSPEKTTKYTFDVWYKPAPDPAKPEVKPAQIHVQYSAVAAVDKLALFHGPEGFDVHYLKGWRTDSFSPEPGSKVYYFQPEQDSVERLAVAVVPIKEGQTPTDMMNKVRDDVPSHYTGVQFVSRYEITRQQEAAEITTFKGLDSTHPNTHTTSIVLVRTHRGKAFIVSARTHGDKFAERQYLLDGLVKSLTFPDATASR